MNYNNRPHAAWIVFATIAGHLICGSAQAAVLNVPAEYPTIQSAILAAAIGDTVALAPGTYTGPGNRDIWMLGKRLRIEGTGGRDVTIIDCQGSPSEPHQGFLFFEDDTKETMLVGLTITNAYTVDGIGAALDGWLTDGAGTIEDCRIVSCHHPGGSIVAGPFDMENCILESCTGAVGLSILSSRLRNVVVQNNSVGIAVAMSGCATSRIEDCIIQGNGGRGVWCQDQCPGAVIERTIIVGNGSGLYVNNITGNLTVRETTIAGNWSDALSGDFVGTVVMENCVFWGNGSLGNAGLAAESWILECCIYPEGAADGGGFTLIGPQIHDDPLFCDERDRSEAPTTEGDYSVDSGSPCLPWNNVCGEQIGALGVGECGVASVPSPNVPLAVQASLEFTGAVPAREVLRFRVDLGGGLGADPGAGLDAGPGAGPSADAGPGPDTGPGPDLGTEIVAQVIDLTGRVLATKNLTASAGDDRGNEFTWRLESSANEIRSGVYFLRVRSESGAIGAFRKFVWIADR